MRHAHKHSKFSNSLYWLLAFVVAIMVSFDVAYRNTTGHGVMMFIYIISIYSVIAMVAVVMNLKNKY